MIEIGKSTGSIPIDSSENNRSPWATYQNSLQHVDLERRRLLELINATAVLRR
jgi:hypothetical protein